MAARRSWSPPEARTSPALVGRKVTKKTVEKTITKAVPVVGGVVSGGLTYVTFRRMGHRLADALVANLNGDFEDVLELNAEFAASLASDVVDGDVAQGDVTETSNTASRAESA